MSQLSNETLLDVFKFLDFYALILIEKTNKHFCAMIKNYEKELAINTDKKMPAVNLIADVLELPFKRLSLCSTITDEQREKLVKTFKGVIIRLTNFGLRGKTYTVIGITSLSANLLTFDFKPYNSTRTQQRTIASHYVTQYHTHLKYPHLPCIHVAHHVPTMYFPPEICEIYEGIGPAMAALRI
ncbi:PAZ domain-containing protein [Meloidogyne graminicola]|uniref:PAZ domain-containing protein n=1 Tax=Meloidogyne graminicola TaxID=189291 RepID=A0A8S9ZDL7_9BILA|nr:PAZ domain-containing protein [Meloidogyne graminicola]